jgi:uncharacterized protein (DUF2267 family)
MTYREFVIQVQRRAHLQTYDDAERITRQVMRAFARAIPSEVTSQLDGNLSREILAFLAPGPNPTDNLIDREVILGWVMDETETTGVIDRTLGGYDAEPDQAGEEAERRVIAVLGVLKSQLDPGQQARLVAVLSPDLGRWLRAA